MTTMTECPGDTTMLPTNFPVTRNAHPEPFNLTVEVTQDFIDNGVKGSVCNCAVALAVKAKLPEGFYVKVNSGKITLLDAGYSARPTAEMPPGMESFIQDFDSGEEVEPRSFSLYFRPVYEV